MKFFDPSQPLTRDLAIELVCQALARAASEGDRDLVGRLTGKLLKLQACPAGARFSMCQLGRPDEEIVPLAD